MSYLAVSELVRMGLRALCRRVEPIGHRARLIYMPIRQCDRDPRPTNARLTERVAQYMAGYTDARAAGQGGGASG